MSSATTDRRMGLTSDKGCKAPCAVATTANITLNGEQTIDGVLTSSTRVLVKNQTDTTQNGIWTSGSGQWTRAIDANGIYDLANGTQVNVTGGSSQAGIYLISGTDPISPGTSAIAAALQASAAWASSALVGYTPAGTGAVVRTVQSKLREQTTPYDKGAVGDGSTDDTTALQNWINEGGGFLPNATFIYSALTLADNCNIWGPGTLKRKTTAGIATGKSYTINATNADNWSIRGVTLDGNKSGQSGTAGFKVVGLLVRGATNFDIDGVTWKDWHEGCVEVTSATQSAPTNAYTAPADVSDAIYRGRIAGNLFVDCGRNVDDGGGYSWSRCLQIGSTTASILVANNRVWNCIGFCQAAAYNRHLSITGNVGYIDSATYTYAGDFIAVEQLSKDSIVANNLCVGWLTLGNIESAIGGIISNNSGSDVKNGLSIFASNIGATATDLGDLVVSGNRIKCRAVTAATFGIRVVKSSGHDAYDVVVKGNKVENGFTGMQLSGVTGGVVSGNYVKGCNTGFDVTGCVSVLVTGNEAKGNVAEGFYFGASNSGVTVSANKSLGNALGCDVVAGQTDLRIYDNDWAGSNSSYDFRIASYSTNNVSHDNNRFLSHSNTFKNLSGATPSVSYVGPTSYFNNGGATTVTAISGGRIGEAYRFVAANGNTTLQHGTNIFMRSHAALTLATNDAITLATDDGTHWYEC